MLSRNDRSLWVSMVLRYAISVFAADGRSVWWDTVTSLMVLLLDAWRRR